MLITAFSDAASLQMAELEAANSGVVLSILPIAAVSLAHEHAARDAGYEVASEFYVGQPE